MTLLSIYVRLFRKLFFPIFTFTILTEILKASERDVMPDTFFGVSGLFEKQKSLPAYHLLDGKQKTTKLLKILQICNRCLSKTESHRTLSRNKIDF